MLTKALQTSTLSHMEVCRRLNVDKGLFSRTLKGKVYRPVVFYDSFYNLLSAYEGAVPVNDEIGIRAYPSGTDRGTWDIRCKGEFIATLRFNDYNDLLDFVKGDERFKVISSFARKETHFDNNIKLR